ncbi:MAG: hypothetical protein ACEPOW_13905 [Bacteroidales bacterium]
MKINRKDNNSNKLTEALVIPNDRLDVIMENVADVATDDDMDLTDKLKKIVSVCKNDNEKALALFHYGNVQAKSQMYLAICENYHPQEAEQLVDFIISQSTDMGLKNRAKVWSKKYYDEVLAIQKKNKSLEGVRPPISDVEYFGVFQFSDIDNLREQLLDRDIDPTTITAEAGLKGALKIKFKK